MSNNMTTPLPTWNDARAIYDDMMGHAVNAVIRACDLGEVLRGLRLTMDGEKFYTECRMELSIDREKAAQLIILSFRRSAVLEALTNGQANDSIRSAYEHVKGLPAPSDETAERERWPRAKRGPKPGSPNAGRPVDNRADPEEPVVVKAPRAAKAPKGASVSPTEWLRSVGYKSPGQTAKDINTWIDANRPDANRHPETLEELTPLMLTAAAAVAPAVIERHAALTQTHEEDAEATLTAVSKQSVAEVKAKLEKAIHARLLGEAQKAVAAAEEQIRAEYNEKLRLAWEEIDQTRAEVNAQARSLNNRIAGIRPLMSQAEWKGYISLCHRDRWPELADDDLRIERLNRLFHVLQKMKDQIDPLTPIAELRSSGWENIAPAHKRNRGKAHG